MNRVIQYRDLADGLAADLRKQEIGYQLPIVRDLAEQYSVSVFTVAKALNLLEIRGIIERRWGVGCFLKSKTVPEPDGSIIGIVLDPQSPAKDEWSHRVLDGLAGEISAAGFTPTYISWTEGLKMDPSWCGLLINANILNSRNLHPTKGAIAWMRNVSADGVPIVTCDCEVPGLSSVMIDNQGGAGQVAKYLAHLGHSRIAYLGPTGSVNSDERLSGLERALANFGVPQAPEMVWNSSISPRVVYAGFPAFAEANRPTAVVCFEDGSAAAVLKAATDIGITVPGDLSIVGFGNLPQSEFTMPPLTTVNVSVDDLCSNAVKLIRAARAGTDNSIKKARINTQLLVRETTAPAKAPRTALSQHA
jgi:LacI family transcriptional regulator